jgi:hypothetical protein
MAKFKGRSVKLNKPMRGDVKKFKVFVKNRKTGRVVKVNFGDKKLSIKKNIPARKDHLWQDLDQYLLRLKDQANNLIQLLFIGQLNHGKKGLKYD